MCLRVFGGVGLRSLLDGCEQGFILVEQVLQLLGQHEFKTGKGKVGNRLAFAHLRVEQQVQGHHGQGHVVLPGGPGARLVLVEPELLLGFLKHALNPVALHLPIQCLLQAQRRGP